MKIIHSNIVMVESGDTAEVIQNWITENTDVVAVNLDVETWTNIVEPNDLIIFNSTFAMFRFPARVKEQKSV